MLGDDEFRLELAQFFSVEPIQAVPLRRKLIHLAVNFTFGKPGRQLCVNNNIFGASLGRVVTFKRDSYNRVAQTKRE